MSGKALSNYCEVLLNIIMDVIDDIIIIHDSEHTVVWMNQAGLKVWGKRIDEVIGKRCYSLMGRTSPCEDCETPSVHMTHSSHKFNKFVSKTEKYYECTSTPVEDENGNICLVVQHLKAI
ncbi:MAG: hypothetical protein PWQ88_881 [Candidatus Methanomethylophilaceae archaeon]|nr:hypothetical protein [Candidatus Methanomethylophilaceae archaeon]MDI3541991.1 hypothetical protein [Candidatus Methanomethylophilaceae archaeon]HIJ00018.1 PAS domain-containing protein [Candidatus Methanomethylophilaceae archaeon]